MSEYHHPYLLEQDPLRQGWGKTGLSSTHRSRTIPPVDILGSTKAGKHERKPLRRCAPAVIFMALSTEVPGSKRQVPLVKDHHMIEEGDQEAAIGAFLLAHEGHTQDVEIQRGTWSIYCRCTRCDDVHTFEVDNEARERAIGLPPWQEED